MLFHKVHIILMGKTFVYTYKCICCNVVSGRLHCGVIVTLMND